MEEKLEPGKRLVQVDADGNPERVVEIVDVIVRSAGTTYDVRVPGSKRVTKDVAPSSLRRIGAAVG